MNTLVFLLIGAIAGWLAGVVINFFVAGSTSYSEWGSQLAYPLASVIITLLIALVADFF